MNLEHYKRMLTELEKTLSERARRSLADARGQFIDSPHDVGDASVAEIAAGDDFTDAELDSAVLAQVQDALSRIAKGTYGKCLEDGAPIGTKRLEAVPWAAYCEKHQSLIDAAARPRNSR